MCELSKTRFLLQERHHASLEGKTQLRVGQGVRGNIPVIVWRLACLRWRRISSMDESLHTWMQRMCRPKKIPDKKQIGPPLVQRPQHAHQGLSGQALHSLCLVRVLHLQNLWQINQMGQRQHYCSPWQKPSGLFSIWLSLCMQRPLYTRTGFHYIIPPFLMHLIT